MTAPTSGQHTPGPWTHFSAHQEGALWSVDISSHLADPIIQPAVAYGRTEEEALANAALIVQAVNSHDALVAAVQRTLDGMDAAMPINPELRDRWVVPKGYTALKAALALATDGVGG